MAASKNPIIGIVMGSDSDWPIMKLAGEILDRFNIAYESKIVSAHRTPDNMYDYAENAKNRGIKCIIAGVAAQTFAWNVGIKNRITNFRCTNTNKTS